MKKIDLAKDIAALAVVGVAYAANPNAVVALGATPPLLGLGRSILSRFSSDRHSIATRTITAVLAGMEESPEITPDLLDEARAVLRAMPDTSGLTPAQLVSATKSGNILTENLVALLMHQIPQSAQHNARGLIETALSAGVRACTRTEAFRSALGFELLQDLSREMAQVRENTIITRELAEQLITGLQGVQRPELNTLAHRFGHADPETAELTDLKGFLMQKAEDFGRYQSQIAMIDDRVAGSSKLKAAAKEAADQLDFAKVELLLADVDKVETEIAVQTKELRAYNALLQGNAQAAFHHLSAAADSFQGLDPIEPARRRLEYEDRLFEHGLRYGGPGLGLAAQLLESALASISKSDQPQIWARAQNLLGIARHAQGSRATGPDGAGLLANSISACRAALRVYQEHTHPFEWAMTLNNLGNALQTLGSRTPGPTGVNLLSASVDVYRDALRVRTEDAYPFFCAATQNNLGAALREQGARSSGADCADLLANSVSAYCAALRVYTKEIHPLDWAMAQFNLGNALKAQGGHIAGPGGAGLLSDASTAYRASLQVYMEETEPLRWSMTQEGLAILEVARANHRCCATPLPHLRAALTAVDKALRVFDLEHTSYHYFKAIDLRDHIRTELGRLGEGSY